MAGAAVPTPPRLTGNPNTDLAAVIEWAWAFYKAVELGGAYAKSIELAGLTDPASGTVATAQQTANLAFILATLQKDRLDAMPAGTVTVTGTNTTAQVTLAAAQADTNYSVALTAQSAGGTPAAGAYTVTAVAKTTTTFTITVSAAPGASNSVTFAWQIQR